MNEPFESGLLRTLNILRAYLPQLVIGGGWAPFLYYRYLADDHDKKTLLTRDIDLFVQKNLQIVGNKPIDTLLTESGFKTIFKSRTTPPLIHYEGELDGCEVEIEFLTDQIGSNPETVIKVQPGLHAEALRFASILIENAIQLRIADSNAHSNAQELIVRVPSPAAYILNKGLVFPRRTDNVKSAKDLYYVFDILSDCPTLKPQIISGLKKLNHKYPKWYQTFSANLEGAFFGTHSEGVLMVLSQRPPTAFENMPDDQLRHFIQGTFMAFLDDVKKGFDS